MAKLPDFFSINQFLRLNECEKIAYIGETIRLIEAMKGKEEIRKEEINLSLKKTFEDDRRQGN